MPNPLDFTDKNKFMSACIIKMTGEGKENDQAVAACSLIWKQRALKRMRKEFLEKIDFEKLSNEKKEHWLKIFPRGEVYIEKYDKTEDINDEFMDSMIEAFNDERLSKPKMDNNHEFGISYADVLELQKRDDGLYARILLNDIGYEAIKNRHYSYISPAFGERRGTDKTVYPNSLSALSLVNYPALEGSIGDLQSQIKLSKGAYMNLEQRFELLNAKMTDLEKVNLSKENKIDTSFIGEITTFAKDAISKITELEKANKEVSDNLLSKENELKTSKEELSKIKEIELKKEAETVVKQAIEDGQFHPALHDKKISDYILNKNSVLDELKVLPKIEKKGQQTFSANSKTLSKEDMEILKSIGAKIDDPKALEALSKTKKE